MRALTAIAALAAGVWGISLAVTEAYDSFFVSHYTSPLEAIIIAALLVNSLVSCWMGMKGLVFRGRQAAPLDPREGMSRRTAAAKILGVLLIVTGASVILYSMFAAYIVYDLRSVLPWTDDMDPLAPYRDAAVLITSICAGWLGFRFVRRRKPEGRFMKTG